MNTYDFFEHGLARIERMIVCDGVAKIRGNPRDPCSRCEFLIFYEETGILSVCKRENFGRFVSKCEIFGVFTRINFEDFGK